MLNNVRIANFVTAQDVSCMFHTALFISNLFHKIRKILLFDVKILDGSVTRLFSFNNIGDGNEVKYTIYPSLSCKYILLKINII